MKKKIIIIINIFIGVMSFISWAAMVFQIGDAQALAASGFSSLKYFTVLSNLFNGGMSLIYAGWLLRGIEITPIKKTWKLSAVSTVGLTFVTVMAFLGPVFGYRLMFQGANLWMHLILPVTSLLSFMFLERGIKMPFKYTIWVIMGALLYGTGYLLNIAFNGIGTWPDSNDFYGFLSWGCAVGAVIFVVIMAGIWLIGAVLYYVGKCRNK